ncbi:GDSL esterase/lipase [Trifolium repens]|nr:GDSL esterase/lipase [Trifolium repens]
MSIFNVFWVINIISLQVFLVNSYCTKSLVPALYVFGDSTVDAGNNNNLNTDAKVNRFPYGIDFNNVSTGRFSNGKTFADILGKFKFCSPFNILGKTFADIHGKTFALTVSLPPPRGKRNCPLLWAQACFTAPSIAHQFYDSYLFENCSLSPIGWYQVSQKFQNTPHIGSRVFRIIQFEMHI